MEHIDSEQRMGASVCKTKEAASWGGLERMPWLLCQGQQDRPGAEGWRCPPGCPSSLKRALLDGGTPGRRRPCPLDLAASVAVLLSRLALKLWILWVSVLPWMNAGQHPVVPVTVDRSRSTPFHVADTAHFLPSDLCPSLAFTLVSQALGASFLSTSLPLDSSACPLLCLSSHSVASTCPSPTPYNFLLFDAPNGAAGGDGVRAGVDSRAQEPVPGSSGLGRQMQWICS